MKRCPNCNGTEIRKVPESFFNELPLADGRKLQFVFEEFPQQVCANCGERTYDAKVLTTAEDAITRDLVGRGVRDPVFKHLRKTLGLKATDLADLLGVTAETMSRRENGHNEPDRAVRATLEQLVDEHFGNLTTTLDRLRAFGETRIPRGPVPLRLVRVS